MNLYCKNRKLTTSGGYPLADSLRPTLGDALLEVIRIKIIGAPLNQDESYKLIVTADLKRSGVMAAAVGTIDGEELVFKLDTNTDAYLAKTARIIGQVIYLEMTGTDSSGSVTRYLLDKCYNAPRLDIAGLPPDPVSDYYTAAEVDALLAAAGTGVSKMYVDKAVSGKVDKVTGKQLSTEDYTTAEKTKLAGLSNYNDTALSNRVTSAQAAADAAQETADDAVGGLTGKVDKVTGKQLSTEDYTTAEKIKLAGLSNYLITPVTAVPVVTASLINWLDDSYNTLTLTEYLVKACKIALWIKSASATVSGNISLSVNVGGSAVKTVAVAAALTLGKVEIALDAPASGLVTLTRDTAATSDTLKADGSVITAEVYRIEYEVTA